MSRKLTVLFAPINYVGPINASIGMGEVLRDSGHRVVFAATSEWSNKLKSLAFEVELMDQKSDNDVKGGGDSADANVEHLDNNSNLMQNKTPLEKALNAMSFMISEYSDEVKKGEPMLRQIIQRVAPDCIISDHVLTVPSIASSGIPWIFSFSSNPLALDTGYEDKRLPPSIVGLSINSDKDLWEDYRKQLKDVRREDWIKYKEWLVDSGCPVLPDDCQLWAPSPYANIYMCAKELDYLDIRPLPNTFHAFDNFKRTESEVTFQVPENLKNKPGKLIYLSLGSMGSAILPVMKRLVAILSKSEHRFIVSKGVKHTQYELADNMWGERTVPQVKVLPIVDLVITHGGNNSVTETMYFGKPMIVLPLFFDQYDNAQRIDEKGFGIRLNPYECTEEQLLLSIDRLLNDSKTNQKLAKVSQRIQSENNIQNITKLVESLAKN